MMLSIIGFNFTRMVVERNSSSEGKINISNNVGVKDVKDAQVNLGGTTNSGVRFIFTFVSTYDPGVGKIELEGDVIAIDEKHAIEQLIKGWNDKKEIPQIVMSDVLNHILNRCNVQALIMSRDINLPSPIPLPKVNVRNKSDAKEDIKVDTPKDNQ